MTTFLVTGAAGKMGRTVVEALLGAKAGTVIAGTRDPARVADLVAKGAEARIVDFDRPESLGPAFAGVDRMLLVSTDSLGFEGKRKRQQTGAVAAAVKAGVKHVVYTSSAAARPGEASPVLDDHYWTEQALAASPISWTALRNNIYTDMLLMSLPQAIASGQLFTATGAGGRNYVTREDCARTAAGALMAPSDGPRILDVTGPAPVTLSEVAAIAAELSGRPVTHVALSGEALKQGMLKAGLPPIYATVLADFDVDAAEGFHAITTPTVQMLSGRAPTTVRDFLTASKAAFLSAPPH